MRPTVTYRRERESPKHVKKLFYANGIKPRVGKGNDSSSNRIDSESEEAGGWLLGNQRPSFCNRRNVSAPDNLVAFSSECLRTGRR